MKYSLKDCCLLFEINDIDSTTTDELRKKYHKLCLKYHPDKNNNVNCHSFIYVKDCYEILLNYKENENQNKQHTIYDYFLSFLTIDTFEKIIEWIKKYNEKSNNNIICFNVTLEHLFNKDLYPHNEVYIPLWHKVITLDEIYTFFNKTCNKNILYKINIINIPSNIKILDNNDIIIYIYDKINLNQTFNYTITNKKIEFIITENILKNKYHIIIKEGIPCINKTNIYDISILSNIIICFIQ